ncbi:MAG: hypothetical protein HOB98_11490 [Gammaproteobacteria bacterium]|nr:hypothetical protein [Gammaproteobacteria bacterium]MBT3870076.1 hypothetical protein [Gammaproteobacteria bacterium]MBT4377773.1 hypothetical protein [Gammaproteobacteria bacterium]MBT4617059.1 hypothetical protein [Gammaproteobacteria bacterium]MBT5197530.1 hypothetical protein [Gammaproteobacteria bacterium]
MPALSLQAAPQTRFRNEFDQTPMALGIEHNFVLVHRLIKALTLGAWMLRFIYMTTPEPKKSGYLKQLLDCPVLFDGEYDGIEFHASDLTKALPSADRQLS